MTKKNAGSEPKRFETKKQATLYVAENRDKMMTEWEKFEAAELKRLRDKD